MIVSGFTQKNFEEEYLHGSPLDHKHCVTCVRRTCKVRADDSTSCPLVNCPRGCASRYHGCKEAEHQALCSEERVPCINSGYGCPLQLPRKRLSQHLVVCPASVVFCSAEWNRSPMDLVKPGAKADVLLKKTYTDCGQLDTAQAMRDHRALVDMLLAPPQTRRSLRNPLTQVYPAAPIGRPSTSPESDPGPGPGPAEEAADVAGEEEGGGWDSTQSWLAVQKERHKAQSQLYEASRQTASSLTSTLTYISDRMDARDGATEDTSGESSVQGAGPSSLSPASNTDRGGVMEGRSVIEGYRVIEGHSVIEGCSGKGRLHEAGPSSTTPTSTTNSNGLNSALTPAQHLTASIQRCSDESGLAKDVTGRAEDKRQTAASDGQEAGDKRQTAVRDGQALNSLLSVSMEVECITKYQPKPVNTYTFLCAQETRRQEFPHHFHAVHNRILPDLNSWMEQRCPLAYLGCPFSFRRFQPASSPSPASTTSPSPASPPMTLCHSWLLDSYGVTSLPPHADPSHRTPPHLLPTRTQTAAGVVGDVERAAAPENSACSAVGQGGKEADTAASVSQHSLQGAHSSASGGNIVSSQSQSAGRGEQKSDSSTAESSALASDSPQVTSDSPAVTSDSPAVTSDSPAVTSDSPAVASDSPVVASDSPGVASDSPAVTGDSPAVASDSPEVASDNSDDTRSLSTPDREGCAVREESFSALLDSISLEQNPGHPPVPSSQKRKKNQDNGLNLGDNSLHPPSPADGRMAVSPPNADRNQGREGREEREGREGRASVQSQVERGGEDRPVTVTQGGEGEEVRAVNGSEQQSCQGRTSPPSSWPPASSSQGERRQVIYTATGPTTCVRVDWVPLSPPAPQDQVGGRMQLCDLPVEILRHVAQFLDSFSLSNLSLVSRSMRDLCCSLLQDRGMVSLLWARQQHDGKVTWQVTGKRWSFSTCFERVDRWSFTGPNPISDHLVTCPYNQDRFRHLAKFSIIPLSSAPMDTQIRHMLQERINRRRAFRGWIIYSNFERYYVDSPQPNVGHFADLLVALGGTLPP